MTDKIDNCMKDCGDGRNIGWWTENHLRESALLIEIKDDTLLISCCEGDRAQKRITFITSGDKAISIIRSAAVALGILP